MTSAGVVAILALVMARFVRGPGGGSLYFPDVRVVAMAELWLGTRLVASIWEGSSASPRLACWISAVGPGGGSAALERLCSHWLRTVLAYSAACALFVTLLRVPLDLLEVAVLGVCLASLSEAMELETFALARAPLRARRAVHAVLVTFLVVAAVAWVSSSIHAGWLPHRPATAVGRLLTAGFWRYVLPVRWTLDLIEALANGGGFLANALAPFAVWASLGVFVARLWTSDGEER